MIKIEVCRPTKCSSFSVETCAVTVFLIICAIGQEQEEQNIVLCNLYQE